MPPDGGPALALRSQFARYRQIAEVLTRHGLGFVVGVTGLARWIPFRHGASGQERRHERYSTPEHLVRALEELGPTFIKLGQLLSTRSDILPANYLRELSRLQDRAPQIPLPVVQTLIEQELGASPDDIFAEFVGVPLACASIGQAHLATLQDGTEVVVKVRRPDIHAQIDTDLDILQNLANQASKRWTAAANYNLPGLVAEFAVSLRRELDYMTEGRNAERFATNFADSAVVHIPRVYWATTTSRVLTLERIVGIKVDDTEALVKARINRRNLATKAADVAVSMVFQHGFYHADPHPGNLFIEAGGRIGLIDFGMVGEVDDALRHQLAAVLAALTGHDVDRLAKALLDLSVVKRTVDRDQFRTDLVLFTSLYRGRRLGEVNVAKLASSLLALLRKHRLQLPQEVASLLRFFLMVEGMGVRLDPDFNLGEFLGPYVRQLMLDRFTPDALMRQLMSSSQDAAALAVEVPDRIRRLFDLLDASGVVVRPDIREIEPMVDRIERLGDRMVAGVVAAAFIRGITELAAADKERWGRYEGPIMMVGLGMAGALGSYLGWTARRWRRRRPRR